jgi:hypothetical protein
MGTRFLIGILIVMMVCPPVSHGFGLLRWTFDAIQNQLGLDRGPILKVAPKPGDPHCSPQSPPASRTPPDSHKLVIQAEGF